MRPADVKTAEIRYILGLGDFKIGPSVSGIDSVSPCGPRSNVDIEYMVWKHVNDFSINKYVLTYVPNHNATLTSSTNIVYITHHRAMSDGGVLPSRCEECVENQCSVGLFYVLFGAGPLPVRVVH